MIKGLFLFFGGLLSIVRVIYIRNLCFLVLVGFYSLLDIFGFFFLFWIIVDFLNIFVFFKSFYDIFLIVVFVVMSFLKVDFLGLLLGFW